MPLPPCFCSPTIDSTPHFYHTPTVRTAANPVLEAVAILLHTSRLLTPAAAQIRPRRGRVPHHVRLEHVRIALDQRLLHFLAFFQMFLRVTPHHRQNTGLFLQLTQLQPLQNTSDAKHSQYSFRHRDFRQLHVCFYPQKGETGKPNGWDRGATRRSWSLQDRASAHAQTTLLRVTNPDHCYQAASFSTSSSTRPQRKNVSLATRTARAAGRLRFHRLPPSSSPLSSLSLLPVGVNAIANASWRVRSAGSAARRRSRSPERTRLRPSCLQTPLQPHSAL